MSPHYSSHSPLTAAATVPTLQQPLSPHYSSNCPFTVAATAPSHCTQIGAVSAPIVYQQLTCTVAHPLPTALSWHFNQTRVSAGPLRRYVLLGTERRAGVSSVLKHTCICVINMGLSDHSLNKRSWHSVVLIYRGIKWENVGNTRLTIYYYVLLCSFFDIFNEIAANTE